MSDYTQQQWRDDRRLSEILEKHKLWFDPEELVCGGYIEFTRKAYGDSYSYSLEEYFDDDYKEVMNLLKALDLDEPVDVYFD